mmetsp:Transcript_21639/g.66525  ORF Transcript_21639/g.66525 Transcript_21639/m.66525 type:complete len:363 (-) Transcript_21639:31-1119(-)
MLAQLLLLCASSNAFSPPLRTRTRALTTHAMPESTKGKIVEKRSRAVRATRVGDKDVLTPEPAAASLVTFFAFQCYLSSQQCAAKAGGDICPLSTIRDWNPDLVTGGLALGVLAAWLLWYGTFRRLAIDARGLEVVAAETIKRDPTGKLEPSPRSWAWGGPDRVNFRDVDDWGILPAGILYVREVSKTASGAERRVPNFYAPTYDTNTVEALMERYNVPKADPSESVLGQGSAAGAAGVVSYIAWEWAFWIGSFGVAACLFNLYESHWPDLRFAASLDFGLPPNHLDLLQVKGELLGFDLPAFPLGFAANNGDDLSNIAASAFVIVNLARLVLPLRLALALATAPFFQRTVVDPFQKAAGKA